MSDYSPDHWLKDQMRDEQQAKGLYDPVNGCVRGKTDRPFIIDDHDYFDFQTYQPTYYKIEKSLLYSSITALEAAIENTDHCLAIHDSEHGRTTIKNRKIAEMFEEEIRTMKQSLDGLKIIQVS